MSARVASLEQQRDLVAGWRVTGRLLEAQRWSELAAQTPEQSRQAAFDMLQLGGMLPADPARDRHSGLVEMQRCFAGAHRRERG
jgi:hypothetical protein